KAVPYNAPSGGSQSFGPGGSTYQVPATSQGYQQGQPFPPAGCSPSPTPGVAPPTSGGPNPYSRGPQVGYPRPVANYQQGYQLFTENILFFSKAVPYNAPSGGSQSFGPGGSTYQVPATSQGYQQGQPFPPAGCSPSPTPGVAPPTSGGPNPYSRGPQVGYPRPVANYQQGYQ
ncbi:proline-rich protein HaeIII subfamily 1-like, partial [Centruroides sculpturatus]|uniref:proline-rich protein HaeIII subfamily 1-like n=1 Tax=Centruroides sculpturatus TaxID=218467 RepID=UPI000C6D9CAD